MKGWSDFRSLYFKFALQLIHWHLRGTLAPTTLNTMVGYTVSFHCYKNYDKDKM